MRFALLTALLALAAPASALAANSDAQVGDDFFDPIPVRIQPGDTVTWHWQGANDHTVTSFANQTDSFRSAIMSGSGTFAHTFAKPGRFTYYCKIHPFTMRAAVEVGSAPFPDTSLPTVTRLKAKVSGSSAKLTFRLSERAKVRIAVSGAKAATKTFGKGSRSYTARHLNRGSHTARLRATDASGNRGRTASKSFRVR